MTLYETYAEAVLADYVGPSDFEDMNGEERLSALHDRIEDAVENHLRAKAEQGTFDKGYVTAGTQVKSETSGQTVANGYKTRPHVLAEPKQINNLLRYSIPGDELKQRSNPNVFKSEFLGRKRIGYQKIGKYRAGLNRLATVTPHKIAADIRGERYMLLPECSAEHMLKFVQLVKRRQRHVDLFEMRKTSDSWRFTCADGTYPSAVGTWAFGAVAFASFITDNYRKEPWLKEIRRVRVVGAGGRDRTEPVPKHLLSLDSARLKGALSDTWKAVKGGSSGEEDDENGDALEKEVAKNEELFYDALRKWIFRQDAKSLYRLLRESVTFPYTFNLLFDHYFTMDIPKPVVESAKAAARHISRQAYFGGGKDREEKNKILAATESLLYDAESSTEMVGRLTSKIGRLTGRPFPEETNLFFDKTVAGEIGLDEARQLLVTYMRTRERGSSDEEKESASTETSEDGEAPAGETTDTSAPSFMNIDES